MDDLKTAHRQGRLVLFVGAGVSANLGLPTWAQLIDEVARQLGYDPKIFATYGDHLALAEFYKRKMGSLGKLRSWMDREWHHPSVDIAASRLHQCIVRGRFQRIYTTNYDRWIEIAHEKLGKPCSKITNVADLAKTSAEERQIIKLHGDFDDDDSLVLDETSYFKRLDFESPLDIKLRSDVLGSSVLFIGYSLKDINIRLLFYKLTMAWSKNGGSAGRPRSYLFTHRPNPVTEEILRHWGIDMIVSDEGEAGPALTKFMCELVE
jgi:hypothetical protein